MKALLRMGHIPNPLHWFWWTLVLRDCIDLLTQCSLLPILPSNSNMPAVPGNADLEDRKGNTHIFF